MGAEGGDIVIIKTENLECIQVQSNRFRTKNNQWRIHRVTVLEFSSFSCSLQEHLRNPKNHEDFWIHPSSFIISNVVKKHFNPFLLMPRDGSRISRRWGCQRSRGAPTYKFARFSPKLHEINENFDP